MPKFRVRWERKEYYPVGSVKEASAKMNELAQADLRNQLVESNKADLEIFKGGKWIDYNGSGSRR